MADRPVHSSTDARDLQPEPKKRGIMGAAGGIFKGGTRKSGPASFNRTTDYLDGAAGGVSAYTRFSRPVGATGAVGSNAYVGSGVQGGSTPGKVIDVTGRAIDTSRISAVGPDPAAPNGALKYTNFDGRVSAVGDAGRALGASGRGTAGHNSAMPGGARPDLPIPTVQAGANPAAAGTVQLAGAAGDITADMHADDITGGASGYNGMSVEVFSRAGDTDEDLKFIVKKDFDSTATGAVFGGGIPAGTYAVYARFRKGNALGPASIRSALVVS